MAPHARRDNPWSTANEEQAQRLLQRAETTCLVTNSLKAAPHLDASVEVAATP
jgi:uncharacterized OsmC-like protein